MPEPIHESAFAEIFLNDTPLMDVRAPLEFNQGAFPCATNIPLLDDDQRATVGSLYKAEGKQAAIDLGNQLVSGQIKESRFKAWNDYLTKNPDALLYCFRGGLRSQTVQQWLLQSSNSIACIEGGYKALRRFLINVIEEHGASSNFMIVAGKTGSGKTHLIHKLNCSIDLEGLANHRGSAFGRRVDSQPSQINFENNLAIALLKLSRVKNGTQRLFLEDESRAIGSLSIPLTFHSSMIESPIAVIEEDIDSRAGIILNDYIVSNYFDFKKSDPENFEALFSDFLLSSLERIQRRLGSENYQKVKALMLEALNASDRNTSLQTHIIWIKSLLQDYYDPMYDYQLGKKMHRIVFRGSKSEFLSWASHIDEHPQHA
ncbi:MAG: tRNA 2-selenouridine(34) synthase MnmH [SAR86 cluster bacterium]|uniref:tRNA 2-selenouridine synthase n=1 Tax=SAR86 cluster bacterium TaxID=2030880 RepID=A0A2A5ANI0_9GAMM|nr:MAG: tRNA 2-selenouridine(34) synthase MnmH [SAR86 cluster bacterium]